MRLNERVSAFIEREALLEPAQPVVVGVSGGPDSLCLLDCLIHLGYEPIVAHFDHQLRAESAEEADFVQALADTFDVSFEGGRGQVIARARSLEEAARLQRYRFLAQVANQRGIERIAVGHTASDQAETVLMHLIRGAGPSGLRGMLPRTEMAAWTEIPEAKRLVLVRPLLEVWRQETEDYCAKRALAARLDQSNQDLRFFRNRLRNELLPQLQSYNPRLPEVLLRTAKVMAAESQAIEDLVERQWGDWFAPSGEGVLELQGGELLSAPLALQRAAMRRAITMLEPTLRDVGFDTIERALDGLRTGTRLTLTGGLDLLTLNGAAYLKAPGARISFPKSPQLRAVRGQRLTVPFRISLQSGWELAGAESPNSSELPDNVNEAWFDRKVIGNELWIRPPEAGDRFKPLGMSGTKKLSDLFVNRKVPWPARERWPVITCGSEIIWVAGLHRSSTALISSGTQAVLRLRLFQPGEMVN